MRLIKGDCLEVMSKMDKKSIDFTMTDIPYDGVNRESGGLRVLDKGKADIITFDIFDFCTQVHRITKNAGVVFCGANQLSEIFTFFENKKDVTCRCLVWEKTNPSPMNGQLIYLSGIEFAVWFKVKGSKVFNAHCKNTVFKYPSGRSKLHPTEKNHALIEDIIKDNTNEGDVVFDPCAGSGTHLAVAKKLKRDYIGIELDSHFYRVARKRLRNVSIPTSSSN